MLFDPKKIIIDIHRKKKKIKMLETEYIRKQFKTFWKYVTLFRKC